LEFVDIEGILVYPAFELAHVFIMEKRVSGRKAWVYGHGGVLGLQVRESGDTWHRIFIVLPWHVVAIA
jgi:hypothetical protein